MSKKKKNKNSKKKVVVRSEKTFWQKMKSQREQRKKSSTRMPMTTFEKIFLALAVGAFFMLVTGWLTDKNLISYGALLIYFVLGGVMLVKPTLLIEVIAKRDKSIWEMPKRLLHFKMGIRATGLLFIAIGAFMAYEQWLNG